MIELPHMLMIGGTRSKVGKTELACRIIGTHSTRHRVIGIKITTVHEETDECPRGGEGCGACTSFDGGFCFTEESTGPPGKDTTRMLEAGAERVLWLRALRPHLEEGILALLEMIDSDTALICESVSLRKIVKPGLFLMVKEKGADEFKPSAEEVRDLADRVIESDGKTFDMDPNDISLANSAWTLREAATAIVMAGGKSSRMGRDKCFLPIEGRPMIEYICNKLGPHFEQLLISANDIDRFSFLGFEVIPDKVPGYGPIMGIVSVLEASDHDVNVVIACDMPNIDATFLRRLIRECEGYEGAVPVTGAWLLEPMCAAYHKNILETFRDAVAAGEKKISDVLQRCNIHFIEVGDDKPFRNINTKEDYQNFITALPSAKKEKESMW
jgi:molybdenum cofactor guanylyltransferase